MDKSCNRLPIIAGVPPGSILDPPLNPGSTMIATCTCVARKKTMNRNVHLKNGKCQHLSPLPSLAHMSDSWYKFMYPLEKRKKKIPLASYLIYLKLCLCHQIYQEPRPYIPKADTVLLPSITALPCCLSCVHNNGAGDLLV